MDQLEAGRETDELVAERVMGFEWWRSSETGRRGLFPPGMIPRGSDEWFTERADMTEGLCLAHSSYVPHYSTDIKDAWQVLREFYSRGFRYKVEGRQHAHPDHMAFVEVALPSQEWQGFAPNEPLAICRAALLAAQSAPVSGD
jgi:hypothetical protein